jgi:hypothetical protein
MQGGGAVAPMPVATGDNVMCMHFSRAADVVLVGALRGRCMKWLAR